MTPKQKSWVALAPGLAGIALILITRWYLAGLLLVLAGVPLLFLLLRCPHCGRYLGRAYDEGRYCPFCGKKIE